MVTRWFAHFFSFFAVLSPLVSMATVPSLAQDQVAAIHQAQVDLTTPQTPLPASPLAIAIDRKLATATTLLTDEPVTAASDLDAIAARHFYVTRGSEPIWFTDEGPGTRARALVAEFQNASDWGLNPADFQAASSLAPPDLLPDTLAGLEIRLTGLAMKYARHARGGRIISPETQLSGFIDRRPNLIEPSKVLEQLATSRPADAVLREFHPKHRQFELLRQAYLAARGERPAAVSVDRIMPEGGPLLAPGKRHRDVAVLRRRLGTALPAAEADVERFDADLAEAVRSFQRSAGLRPDGMVGEKTRKALNEQPGGASADQLLANMEAWRWMPDDLGATHVEVNLPEQVFRFVRDGNVIHSERVIIGKMETATPLFSDTMETIVFQPTWGVPNSIKINELLPDLRAGNGLRNGLRMKLGNRDIDPWDVDWNRADITKYLVYQPSGDDNALGDVKFLFPNTHAVYMHDTPNRRLFGSQTRMFSHGCVRVKNPMRFAELLLEADRGMLPKDVRRIASDGPEDNKIRLNSTIPVHIIYFTARVSEDGKVVTAPDLYGHEKRITLALQGQFSKIKKLDPPVIDPNALKPTQVAARPSRTRVTATARTPRPDGFAQPWGLGYSYRPQTPSWSFFSPSQPAPRRGRGNAPSDLIMRSFVNDIN